MSKDKKEGMVGGIKATNEFHPPKRQRKPRLKVMNVVEHADKEQVAEETAHKPVTQPQPKSERPMTLVLKDKNTYYGTREIWERLFAAFHMTRGKIRVKNIGISEDSDGVHAELDIEPVLEENPAT